MSYMFHVSLWLYDISKERKLPFLNRTGLQGVGRDAFKFEPSVRQFCLVVALACVPRFSYGPLSRPGQYVVLKRVTLGVLYGFVPKFSVSKSHVLL